MKISDKYAPNLILSIILVFSLIGFTFAAVLNFYVTNEKAYITNEEENNVPAHVREELEKYFDYSTDYSKIPADVYMSAVSEDDIRQIINKKITNIFNHYKGVHTAGDDKEDYDYKRSNFDYSALEKSISDYFADFAEKNNVDVNEEYEKQLQNTIDTAESEIENAADVYMLTLIDGTSILEKAAPYYDDLAPTMYVCAGIAFLCMLLLITISLKRSSLACYWMSVSFICASLIMLVPTLIIKLSGFEERLIVRNNSIYTAVTTFISKVVNGMIFIELGVIVLGGIMLVLYFTKQKKLKKKKFAKKRQLEELRKSAFDTDISEETGKAKETDKPAEAKKTEKPEKAEKSEETEKAPETDGNEKAEKA